MDLALYVEQATKRYGSTNALAGVDLKIERGEFFALLGPNGAGKTTLISALAGLVRLDSGDIHIMGHDVVRDYREARQKVGIVPQELVFDPFFTVRECLRIQSGYFGIRNNDDWIDEILANLDLTLKADANMRSLSGGMKRRVLVAQALVHRPPLIVLDEPTAGVDVELRQGLWQFIRKLNSRGHTILLTTHYLEEAQSLCSRIAMLKAGQIIALDKTENLLRRTHTHVLEVHLAEPCALSSTILQRARSAGGLAMSFEFEDYSEVENILRGLREAGAKILEMEIVQPDLEDVFLKLMGANA